ncbi:hypothetical protein V1527DRAFT_485556 [Lipomyces starkeyi]
MAARFSMTPAIMPMRGKVVLEEAFQPPWEMDKATDNNIGLYVTPEREPEYESGIVNIQDRVRERVLATPFVLSLFPVCRATRKLRRQKLSPSIPMIGSDGAFAAVSMHNPRQAVLEMRRAIKELGLHGVMVNNWQHALKPNGERTLLLYDAPEYDVFWAALQELDVPLHIHPAAPEAQIYELLYKNRPYLQGPPQSFAIDVILGHMGEPLPYDLDRTHGWLEKVEKSHGMVAQKTIYEYFKDNIWLTTSGQFSTAVLNFCINLVGADRILYSVDYPYECYHDASNWFDNVNINTRDKLKIGRENAQSLRKLHDLKDSNTPYFQ